MSKKTIIVCGYGPGISNAIAERFGREGFSVALVARNEGRLADGVKALRDKGIEAAAFPADLGDAAAIRGVVEKVRSTFGPVTVLQWNAYGTGAGDLTTASAAELRGIFDVPVFGLLSAVQEVLPDLRKDKESALLVTNGGLGYFDPNVDAVAAQWGVMGLAVANAAKHKVVGLLSEKLKGEGIYVGEVVVLSTVKGTAFDQGNATIEAGTVADTFWTLYRERSVVSTNVG